MPRAQTYIPIFQVSLLHGYHGSGLCQDFSFRPTGECAGLLQNAKLRLVATANGFQIAQQARLNGQGQIAPMVPLSDIPNGTRFTFAMDLKQPEFSLKTQLSTPGTPAPPLRNHLYLFSSAGADVVMGPGNAWLEKVHLYDPPAQPGPDDYPRTLPQSSPLVTYTVEEPNPGITEARIYVYGPEKGENGLPEPGLSTVVQKNDEDEFRPQLDLGDYPEGAYTFVLQAGNAVLDRRVYYVSAGTGLKGAFGVIEIRKTADWDSIPPHPAIDYTIRFLPAKSAWRYILVYKHSPFPDVGEGTHVLEDETPAPLLLKNVTARERGAVQATAWVRITGFSGNANAVRKITKLKIDGVNLLPEEVVYQTGDTPATFALRLRDEFNQNISPYPRSYRAYIDPADDQKVILLAPPGTGTWPNGLSVDLNDNRVNYTHSPTLSGGANPGSSVPGYEVNGYPAEIFLTHASFGNTDTVRLPLEDRPRGGVQLLHFRPGAPLDSNNPHLIRRDMPLPPVENSGSWFDPDLNMEFNTKDLYFFI